MTPERLGTRTARRRAAGETETAARVDIQSDRDILAARQNGRALAGSLGFTSTNLTVVAAVISELARNILVYAKRGELFVGIVGTNGRQGIEIIARDRGPGIVDVDRAMRVGYSTSGNLGLGLPGVRRLVDEFEIESKVGRGTTVTARKWKS